MCNISSGNHGNHTESKMGCVQSSYGNQVEKEWD